MESKQSKSPQGGSTPTEELKAISYDQTKADRPPVAVKHAFSAERLFAGHAHGHNSISNTTSSPALKFPSHLEEDVRRDSGLAPSSLQAKDSRTTLTGDDRSATSMTSAPSIPQIRVDEDVPHPSQVTESKLSIYKKRSIEDGCQSQNDAPFRGITMDIPTGGFEDISPDRFNFSKRGSIMFDSKTANGSNGRANGAVRGGSRRITSTRPILPPPKVLSTDEEALSQKVRSMYEAGLEDFPEPKERSNLNQEGGDAGQVNEDLTLRETNSWLSASRKASNTDAASEASMSARSLATNKAPSFKREDTELAGGLEDWQNVEVGNVDRYGFILPRSSTSGTLGGVNRQSSAPEPQRLQRVSTSLQLATEAPRRKHTIRRTPSNAKSTKSLNEEKPNRQASKRSARPPSSQGSFHGSIGGTSSKLRYATNKLPHNKDRKVMDEAGDMLTLPPGLTDMSETEGSSPAARELKKKEWQREEKWRKMAKVVSKGAGGSGMVFAFDTTNPKLVERTWKGIPDRWRATAWHSFLAASAKKSKVALSDEELIQIYLECQDQSSPDDVQIDIDVPRTINSHIMFRRRYRGGQRLLFRVLHAMSLYFPDTGYVQGMAALAATLLAYYDEENAFVMLVRLWQHRGLDELYKSGFEGLMEALDDFEKHWLAGGEIAVKLVRSSHLERSHEWLYPVASCSCMADTKHFRPNWGSRQPHMAHDGTSPYSTTRYPFPHSYGSGMFLCSSEMQATYLRPRLGRNPAGLARHLTYSTRRLRRLSMGHETSS